MVNFGLPFIAFPAPKDRVFGPASLRRPGKFHLCRVAIPSGQMWLLSPLGSGFGFPIDWGHAQPDEDRDENNNAADHETDD